MRARRTLDRASKLYGLSVIRKIMCNINELKDYPTRHQMDVSGQCKTYRKSQGLPLGTFAFRIPLKTPGLNLLQNLACECPNFRTGCLCQYIVRFRRHRSTFRSRGRPRLPLEFPPGHTQTAAGRSL